MPRDSEGREDLKVAVDVLVKVKPEDPFVSTLDVYFVAKDDWCAARIAREVASSCFFQCFVLEPILTEGCLQKSLSLFWSR